MRIYDRLYGELIFPDIIQNLLDCPALLRLRDVRMANNQFAAFPAFSNSSRYEHSLGVCHLADICAKKLGLSEKNRLELMMACLYHDVGTPPFAHAMEEVLQAEYGFDHEDNLRNLVEGRNESYVGALDQIYLSGSIKLKSICQSKKGRKLGLDVYRIAKIIIGDKQEPLSFLLNGNGMDLDNIDNIVRASTAMGIIDSCESKLAEQLASSFILNESGTICYDASYKRYIQRWQEIRDEQYTAIFDSIDDFAYQTMIKKALAFLIKADASSKIITKESWKLTDGEILYEYLLKNEKSKDIIKNVMLEKPFRCLGILYVQGEGASRFLNNHLSEIEKVTSVYYSELMGITEKEVTTLPSVVANFYPDKRKRQLRTGAVFMGRTEQLDDKDAAMVEGALLGLFTPILSNRYKTITQDDGKRIRKKASYSSENINDIKELLQDRILFDYEVSIYGKRKDNRASNPTSEDQLGLF